MLTESQVAVIANDVLSAQLGPSGFEHAEVRSGLDHDGDASLFITAQFKPRSGVTMGAASTLAHAALRRQLLNKGEERFPYIQYRYPDDEVLVGEEEPGRA